MDYKAIIHAIVDPIVEHPESILIRETEESERDLAIIVCAEKDDTARLIGRKGIIANSIREMVSVAGKTENKRIHIKFESFENEEE